MNIAEYCFEVQLTKVAALLDKAATEENPAQWLFKNDLRTPMFMLQGLARVYMNLHGKKPFEKLKDDFKAVEDTLGAIDYYNAFQLVFEKNKKIPVPVKQYFNVALKQKTDAFHKLLEKEDWLNGKKIKKIRKKIDSEVELNDKQTVKELKSFYEKQIKKLYSFCEELNYKFTDIEEHVHEFRRKLRWLSIYPHALQGVIKLTPSKTPTAVVKKYLTAEVTGSPYNQLPVSKEKIATLDFDKNTFLASSWVIGALGKLKDSGLTTAAVAEALKETGLSKDGKAEQEAYKLLGAAQPKTETLLREAEKIVSTFFKEGHLLKLVKK